MSTLSDDDLTSSVPATSIDTGPRIGIVDYARQLGECPTACWHSHQRHVIPQMHDAGSSNANGQRSTARTQRLASALHDAEGVPNALIAFKTPPF